MKIRPVGAQLFHAEIREDGRIDITKVIVAFRNFWNALKNEVVLGCIFRGFVALEKYSNIKFHENPYSGSPVVERREDGRTDITKVIVAIRNFWNAPKNEVVLGCIFPGFCGAPPKTRFM